MRKILIFVLLTFFYCINFYGSESFSITQNFFKFNTKMPLKISSKTLEVKELKNGIYRFDYKGNVIVLQNENKIYSDELIIFYNKKKKLIRKLVLIGNVKIKGKDAICACDKGIYYPLEKKIKLLGNIKILQDKNLFNGDELDIDLKTNVTILKGKGKRINTIFGGTENNVKSK